MALRLVVTAYPLEHAALWSSFPLLHNTCVHYRITWSALVMLRKNRCFQAESYT